VALATDVSLVGVLTLERLRDLTIRHRREHTPKGRDAEVLETIAQTDEVDRRLLQQVAGADPSSEMRRELALDALEHPRRLLLDETSESGVVPLGEAFDQLRRPGIRNLGWLGLVANDHGAGFSNRQKERRECRGMTAGNRVFRRKTNERGPLRGIK
jgi:hypothetical protein